MEGGIVSEFHKIYNSFPLIENSKGNETAFDCLPFTSEMNLQRSMISILRVSQSVIVLLNDVGYLRSGFGRVHSPT